MSPKAPPVSPRCDGCAPRSLRSLRCLTAAPSARLAPLSIHPVLHGHTTHLPSRLRCSVGRRPPCAAHPSHGARSARLAAARRAPRACAWRSAGSESEPLVGEGSRPGEGQGGAVSGGTERGVTLRDGTTLKHRSERGTT